MPLRHSLSAATMVVESPPLPGHIDGARVMLGGAGSGAITGALFVFVFGLFDRLTPLVSSLTLALYGALFEAVVGALVGLLAHAATGGRREFTSVSAFQADRYTVVVDDERADSAARVLAKAP